MTKLPINSTKKMVVDDRDLIVSYRVRVGGFEIVLRDPVTGEVVFDGHDLDLGKVAGKLI